VRCFQHAHRPAHVVRRARTPRIAVRTDDHQLIGQLAAHHDAEGVVDLLRTLRRAIVAHRDAGSHRSRAGVIAKRESTLPPGGQIVTAKSGKELARIRVRDRHDGNVGQIHAIGGKAGRVRRARIAGRGRIACAVEDAAALDPIPVSHGPRGIDVATHVPVVLGVAVDEQRHGAVPLRLARLDAAERATIARDGDAPVDRYAERVESRVVLDQPVVHVHDLARDLAHPAVAVHGGVLPFLRRRVARDGGLAEQQLLLGWRGAPQTDRGRVRHEDGVAAHLGLQSHRAHLLEHVVAGSRLRRCARDMRLRRKRPRVPARDVRAGAPDDVVFEPPLGVGGRRGEAWQGWWWRRCALRMRHGRPHAEETRDDGQGAHGVPPPVAARDGVH
jgi:hypothetical protein